MCAPALSGISPCTESRRRAPLSGDVNVYVDPHENALRNKALGLDPDATLPTKVKFCFYLCVKRAHVPD